MTEISYGKCLHDGGNRKKILLHKVSLKQFFALIVTNVSCPKRHGQKPQQQKNPEHLFTKKELKLSRIGAYL